MRILTCDPKLEMLGINLRGFIDNIQASEIEPILKKYGLTNIEPLNWYLASTWVQVFNDLQESNTTSNFVAIGMEVGRIIPMPRNSDFTLPEVLMLWNAELYQPLFRNGDPGTVSYEKVSDTHYVSIHRHIWPDDFNYGMTYAFARRFLPPKTQFKVYYDQQVPRLDEGGNETRIHIAW